MASVDCVIFIIPKMKSNVQMVSDICTNAPFMRTYTFTESIVQCIVLSELPTDPH